jgi:hypothetical protein
VRTGQQVLQSRWEIVRVRARDFLQRRFDACEFIGQHSLEQIDLARKMGVERFLANAQLLGQIIHGHAAESVAEKVDPRSIDNSLPVRIALSTLRPPFVCRFHIRGLITVLETNPVYLVSTVGCRYLMYQFLLRLPYTGKSFESHAEIDNALTMAGYSGTPLPQKLGIKPSLTVVTINAPTNYRRLLGTIPEGVTFSDRLKPDSSFVHVFIQKRSELEKRLSALREKIADTGTVWISWPKRSSGVPTDVTEDVVRAVALPLGFVDVKVCAIDETWSGLKLMVRRTNRKPPVRK